MSENNLFEAIDTIVSEKNITKEDIAQELSESIKKTYCYFFNYEGELTVDVNFNNKNISFIKSRKIVNTVVDSDLEISISEVSKIDRNNKQEVDEVFEEVIPFSVFPRLQILKICQSFKQGILKLQKEYIYNEYLSRKGEILVGIVESVESYNYIINLGNNTAILPHKLKIPGEQFNVGDKIKFYVLDIFTFPSSNFGQILASRSNYEFLVSLFTSEIPEIQQKNVSIKKVAWKPGIRGKIAVVSNDPLLKDPVGACISKGSHRISDISRELADTKLDVVKWDEDLQRFLVNAFNPSKVISVQFDVETDPTEALVIVPDEHLMIAIGKQGIAVRLVTMLTGLTKINVIGLQNAIDEKNSFTWNGNITEKELANLQEENMLRNVQRKRNNYGEKKG